MISIVRRVVGSVVGLMLAAGGTIVVGQVAGPVGEARAWDGLATTPPMGYNNWSFYQCKISEDVILAQAKALVSTGLAKKGYDTVTIDDCWMSKQRDKDGTLVADAQKFPHGMMWMGEQIHALGLKFGIYEDAGTTTCGGFAGSWKKFDEDAATFAKWKVDYIKLDGCNVPDVAGETSEATYRYAYKAFSEAILKTHRKMVFSESAPAYFENTPDDWYRVLGWVAEYGNLWREGDDIALSQDSAAAKWKSLNYNYSYNVGLWKYAGPGHWNDPDFLLVGDAGLSDDEMQTQMLLWAEMAAPLISSTDLTKASAAAIAILGNEDVIAVDQDRLGVQGHVVQFDEASDVLAKRLANGDVAVVMYNRGETAKKIEVTTELVGLGRDASVMVRDLVSKGETKVKGKIGAMVVGHGAVMVRVSVAGSK